MNNEIPKLSFLENNYNYILNFDYNEFRFVVHVDAGLFVLLMGLNPLKLKIEIVNIFDSNFHLLI